MFDVEIAAHPAEAIGRAQFHPAVGGINRAAKLFGSDEGFDEHDGMRVAGLPVGAEAVETQAQRTGAEVGKVFAGRRRKRQLLTTRGRRRRRCSSLQPCQ